jgi:predicted 3-demethylubiquinone-9 3-methyltransferase (glyoxalase superfamily)
VQKIVPFLWYVEKPAEAATFYASVFPDSHIDQVTTIPSDTPGGPAETVETVEFTLLGQPFMAIGAGPLDPFNHAVSFMVMCADQSEIDRYWEALLDGGQAEQCGWLRDRYGLAWQIVPGDFGDMAASPDRAAAKRASDAMLGMVKLDIAVLLAAFDGKG